MRRRLAAALAAAALAFPLGAASARAQAAAPAEPGIINGSLMEALVAVRRPELAGVFAFVPETQAPLALADLLIRDRAALERFVKANERDTREYKVVDQWDKEVFLHIVAATAGGSAPPGVEPLPKRLSERVNALALVDGAPLELLAQRRAGKVR